MHATPARSIRRGAVLAVIAASLFAAPQVAASTTVGEDFSTSDSGCGGPTSDFHVQITSPASTYAAPFDGVLTSWTSNTDNWTTGVLKVVRLGSGSSFTVLGQDGPRASDGIAHQIRISIRQGDVLGLYMTAPTGCVGRDMTGYSTGHAAGDVGLGPGTFNATYSNYQIPVTAQIEHDADGDGYGDETQDGCPTDASKQGPCSVPDTTPPDTTISKGPKKRSKSKSATFEFSSTEPGSSFECSVDSSGFKPCTSPDKVKVRGTGKHNFLVRARDAAGNLDTSEASYSWKLVKKKHKKHNKHKH